LHVRSPSLAARANATSTTPTPSSATLAVVRSSYYVSAVIRSWRNAASRKIWEGARPNHFRGLYLDVAIDLLLALNVAKSLQDPSPLRSVGLHKLKGDRQGSWAMTVNGPWRIGFEFGSGDAYEVEIVDYHKE
jgi:toxin HigB-1